MITCGCIKHEARDRHATQLQYFVQVTMFTQEAGLGFFVCLLYNAKSMLLAMLLKIFRRMDLLLRDERILMLFA